MSACSVALKSSQPPQLLPQKPRINSQPARLMGMTTVYVLKSIRHGKRYVGLTEREVETRINEHNSGVTPWTRENGPFELVYSEIYENHDFARRRERYFKSGKGRRALDNLLTTRQML
jgi:putative endonuclease